MDFPWIKIDSHRTPCPCHGSPWIWKSILIDGISMENRFWSMGPQPGSAPIMIRDIIFGPFNAISAAEFGKKDCFPAIFHHFSASKKIKFNKSEKNLFYRQTQGEKFWGIDVTRFHQGEWPILAVVRTKWHANDLKQSYFWEISKSQVQLTYLTA